ncbi:MAG: PD40 domain-containing protein, partial [Myxococcales bacterium]|nr:PD40 domain-containing protein [Myxococcales bacterium]
QPSWSPDGDRLVFTSSRSGSPQIWMATAAGTDLVQLTTCEKACWLPRWVPDAAAHGALKTDRPG